MDETPKQDAASVRAFLPPDLPKILQSEITSIRDYLKAVEQACDAGFTPDMAGLDQRVAQLCTVLTAADPAIQKTVLAEFNALLTAFDSCESVIKKHAAKG